MQGVFLWKTQSTNLTTQTGQQVFSAGIQWKHVTRWKGLTSCVVANYSSESCATQLLHKAWTAFLWGASTKHTNICSLRFQWHHSHPQVGYPGVRCLSIEHRIKVSTFPWGKNWTHSIGQGSISHRETEQRKFQVFQISQNTHGPASPMFDQSKPTCYWQILWPPTKSPSSALVKLVQKSEKDYR